MHDVYRHSHCNIVVADSVDSKGGLFRERKPADIVPAKVVSDGTSRLDRGTWRVVRDGTWDAELLSTKIYTRGWVFQGMLRLFRPLPGYQHISYPRRFGHKSSAALFALIYGSVYMS